MNSKTKGITIMLATVLTGGFINNTFAADEARDTNWQKTHPRREQVNERLANQNKRINKEVKEGDLTKAQAAKLHQKDRQVRREERLMASQNGGHITKQEQKTLNQQENAISKKIGN